ncbi:hypothetical protein FHX42_000633 [Saccharopolyspora lacisalsi]|uniref:DUF6545 domain-containing protein n=1 Tax=Halosaccharopolyspora lacisalsi TaxID=1000566 RepID=A0A839DP96_9PSEU|nr:MAB_1171c family putative transporter [Halosaccharopolyspora lacisalsi]MBA8823304.1 hypothetical protein [Halosaccharopolyspora lacisalsi]
MNTSALFLTTAVICFAVAGYRSWMYRRGKRPTEIPLMVSCLALGSAFVALAPIAQQLESQLHPGLGRLLSNVCTLVAAFGFLHLMLYIGCPDEQVPSRVRPRLIALVVAVVVMVVMFFASRLPPGLGIFTGLYRSQPTLTVYTLTYAAYLAAALLDLSWLALRSLRHTRGWLRAGMIMLSLGALLGISYVIDKTAGVLTEVVTGTAAEPYCPSAFATVGCTFAIGMPALSVLAILVGAALPTLGPRVGTVSRWFGDRRRYRHLDPLWRALSEHVPEVGTAAPVDAALPRRAMSLRLYRRVIGIRDGLMVLRPFRDDPEAPRRSAAAEAAEITTALERYRAGVRPSDRAAVSTVTETDFAAEARWLTLVSQEFRALPTPGPSAATAEC